MIISKYQIFKETVNRAIQNSGLDIGAIYFIMKDVFNSVEKTYIAQINKECLEEAEKINNENKEETME